MTVLETQIPVGVTPNGVAPIGVTPRGVMRDYSLVVSAEKEELINQSHAKAVEIFGELVSNIVRSSVTGLCSFFIAPDGIKGSSGSADGDSQRVQYIAWLEKNCQEGTQTFYASTLIDRCQ
jgi:hypothetical protein